MKTKIVSFVLLLALALALSACGKTNGNAVSVRGGSPIPNVEAVCGDVSCM